MHRGLLTALALCASAAHAQTFDCDLAGDPTNCPLDSLSPNTFNLLRTGGDTRCLLDYTGPYGFQVTPGRSDRVLIYFDGGGACFNEATTGFLPNGAWTAESVACQLTISPEETIGVFDTTDPRNAFRDYTIILLLYCSGDNFVGDTVRSYRVPAADDPSVITPIAPGAPESAVVHTGLNNTRAVLAYVKAQQEAGLLAGPEDLVVVLGGESAGAAAGITYAAEISDLLEPKAMITFSDSFVGIFPPDSFGLIVGPDFLNGCEAFYGAALQRSCRIGTICAEDVAASYFEELGPDSPLLFITPKDDPIQTFVYNTIALTLPGPHGGVIDSAELYFRTNLFLQDLRRRAGPRGNMAAFFVADGRFHTFTDEVLYYTATTASGTAGDTGAADTLFRWLGLTPGGDEACEQCLGPLERVSRGPLAPQPTGTDYCAEDLAKLCARPPRAIRRLFTEAPSEAPSAAPSGPPLCSAGIKSADGAVCCSASCLRCGGCTCAEFRGGAALCCTDAILRSEIYCVNEEDVACILDVPQREPNGNCADN